MGAGLWPLPGAKSKAPPSGRGFFTPLFDEISGEAFIASLAVQADGQVLVGGNFTAVNGLPVHDIVRLNGDPVPPRHPADLTPSDWHLTAVEVHNYATAWRSGALWSLPPNPIPIDYVTRAGALWQRGPCYKWDPTVAAAPLWWVNCRINGNPPAAILAASDDVTSHAQDDGVEMQFAHSHPHPVMITVKPTASVKAWAVEDQPPPGWTVSHLSDGGVFDAVNRKVKWGPFYDDFPRSLKYKAWPPANAPRDVVFVGCASFDGVGVDIIGRRHRRVASRLVGRAAIGHGQFWLTVSSEPGARYVIERSTDLVTWTPWMEITNAASRLEFTDSEVPSNSHRYYRARLVGEMERQAKP